MYVGGDFTTAGEVTASHVARWDGRQWHALGAGAVNGVDGQVLDLLFVNGTLFRGRKVYECGRSSVTWCGALESRHSAVVEFGRRIEQFRIRFYLDTPSQRAAATYMSEVTLRAPAEFPREASPVGTEPRGAI
jgi:hypothetical protein